MGGHQTTVLNIILFIQQSLKIFLMKARCHSSKRRQRRRPTAIWCGKPAGEGRIWFLLFLIFLNFFFFGFKLFPFFVKFYLFRIRIQSVKSVHDFYLFSDFLPHWGPMPGKQEGAGKLNQSFRLSHIKFQYSHTLIYYHLLFSVLSDFHIWLSFALFSILRLSHIIICSFQYSERAQYYNEPLPSDKSTIRLDF